MGRKGLVFRIDRARREEVGYTIIEMMVAALVLLLVLTSVAYTATTAFSHTARARQRQDATGIANMLVEQASGLAYPVLEDGMSSTDLAGDPHITACTVAGQNTSCYGGEKLVVTAESGPGTILNPHRVNVTVGEQETVYHRAAYLTYADNDLSGANLRFTARVSWDADHDGTDDQTVIVQRVIERATQCPAGALHLWEAACAPFFQAEAKIGEGKITISPTGTSSIAPFPAAEDSVQVVLPGLSSSVDAEQASRSAAGASTSGVARTITSGGAQVTDSCGLKSFNATATNNQTTGSNLYQTAPSSNGSDTVNCTPTGNPPTITVPATVSSSSPHFVLSKTALDLPASGGWVNAAVSAGGSNSCGGESDAKPCSYSVIRQGGVTRIVLNGPTSGSNGNPQYGNCTLAEIESPSADSTILVDREGTYTRFVITRRYPTITIGCTPSHNLTSPSGFNPTSSSANFDPRAGQVCSVSTPCRGYLLRIKNWTVTATMYAGPGAPANPAPTRSGTIYYWTGSSYATASAPTATASGTIPPSGSIGTVNQSSCISAPNGQYRTTVQLGVGTAVQNFSVPAVTTTSSMTDGIPSLATASLGSFANLPDMQFILRTGNTTGSCNTVQMDHTISFVEGATTGLAKYTRP